MTWILLAVSYAWTIFVEYTDAQVSRFYPLYDTGEANFWARGKDGYFSLSKSIRNTAIVLGGFLALAIFLPFNGAGYVVAGIVAAMGLVIWTVVSKNKRRQKEQRARQEKILEGFQEGTITTQNIDPFKDSWVFSPGSSMGGGTTFYDIRVPKIGDVDNTAERIRAATALTEKFLRVKADKKLWWSLDRGKV